ACGPAGHARSRGRASRALRLGGGDSSYRAGYDDTPSVALAVARRARVLGAASGAVAGSADALVAVRARGFAGAASTGADVATAAALVARTLDFAAVESASEPASVSAVALAERA